MRETLAILGRVVRRLRFSPTAACAHVILLATAGAAPARTHPPKPQRVPLGFFGMNLDRPTFPPDLGVNMAQQFDVMVRSGVESVRVEFDWAATQPYATWSDVPADQRSDFTDVDGLPLNLGELDQLVKLCAQRGLSMRPVVLDAPKWDATSTSAVAARTPRRYAPYGAFMKALVDRYGPRGSLWQTHSPRLPIHIWQVWNEPNIAGYWAVQPNFERSYVDLLRVAHRAIKSADPEAQVVLAGMVNASWVYLQRIYRVPGARSLFDIVGVHPYTRHPQGVHTILNNIRRVMDAAGDRNKAMLAEEVGWNSSAGKSPEHFGVEVSEALQARNVAAVLPWLVRQRARLRLLGINYYNWAGVEQRGGPEFTFAGLFRFEDGRYMAKPVYGVFRRNALAAERCRQKTQLATRCRTPA